jgi:hypothetical protein
MAGRLGEGRFFGASIELIKTSVRPGYRRRNFGRQYSFIKPYLTRHLRIIYTHQTSSCLSVSVVIVFEM